jgi:hypothetical protein
MPKGMVFWLIYIVCLVLWLVGALGAAGPYGHYIGGGVVEFILFFLLGWGIFGFAIT